MASHVCGQCRQEFPTESAYTNHTCPVTGFNPLDPNHLGAEFAAISDAAIARGEARKLAATQTGAVGSPSEAEILSAIKAARNKKP